VPRIRIAAAASLLVAAAHLFGQSIPADFDAYVRRTMDTFHVPGMSIAVVKDGKVLLAKGYGVSKLGSPDLVTADTLFGIASNTKIFTASALAILVDEGKIGWDDRVQKHLPAFALSDPFVSHELTIRDLLVHRSGLGLGAGDLLWWPSTTYSADEVIERLRYLPLKSSFRSTYAYDNVLYLVAGQLIQKVSGMPWHQFIDERILKRVGMNGSTTTYADAAKTGRLATTHAFVDGRLQVIEPMKGTVTGPAGGINSSANDMAKWLQVQLAGGRLADGGTLFSPARSFDLWSPVTPIPGSPNAEPGAFSKIQSHFTAYALGLVAADYRGKRMLNHTGGLPGYLSWVSMLPEEKLGIVVLTNQESSDAFCSVAFRLLDHFLGVDPVDWVSEYENLRRSQQVSNQAASPELKRNKDSRPSLPLDGYARTYRDKWYGDITIRKEDNKLVMRFSATPGFVGDLEHWNYDTFVVRWRDRSLRADAFITFMLTPDGRIDFAKMAPYDGSVDFSFDFQDLHLVPR
jgi:CubicO group peptidase (beta-lactamase class C family)